MLGIYPVEIITEKNTCTPMFIEALLTTASTWKQLRHLSTDKLIKKMCYIYKLELLEPLILFMVSKQTLDQKEAGQDL